MASAAGGAAGAAPRIHALPFDNRTLRALPIDPEPENFVRRVSNAVFSRVKPAAVTNPTLVAVSAPALALLGCGDADVADPDFVQYMSGNKVLPGADPAAHCYCGHQFGSFAGQLGDGAAMYLGEVVNDKGERWELQFKGAGRTPYSRTADGRKVLRSSIREFLCSEAMHALGIPTTRAATVVTSDTMVQRDIFYTGDVVEERATIITRIAPTFIRFGSFEIFKEASGPGERSGPSAGNAELRQQLADFVVESYYADTAGAFPRGAPARYRALVAEVTRRTGELVAQWQSVGWCHGVLNTDNMSIVGVTLDYGPFGWLDRYDPDAICNSSDNRGRYTYRQQPSICRWNCAKLAEALRPLLGDDWDTEACMTLHFDAAFSARYSRLFCAKLGLGCSSSRHPGHDEDHALSLARSLLETMHATGADFTNTFRILHRITFASALAEPHTVLAPEEVEGAAQPADEVLDALLQECASPAELAQAHRPRIPVQELLMLQHLVAADPRFADHAEELNEELARLDRHNRFKAMSLSDKQTSDRMAWREWLHEYRRALADEARGFASDASALAAAEAARLQAMCAANPVVVLRNWLAQRAIRDAEAGDFKEVQRLLEVLQTPYDEAHVGGKHSGSSDKEAAGDGGEPGYTSRPPGWACGIRVSCSS